MFHPDTVLHRGRIHTMDPARPLVEAIAVHEGRIAALGSDEQLAEEMRQADQVIDLDGRSVLPGLLDAHNHHKAAGQASLFELSIAPSDSVAAICDAVAAWAADLAPGEWVQGGTWGSGLLPQLATPEVLARLDAASGDRPVLLVDDSQHNRWANSAALRIAGISASTPDPEGGQIVRAASGAPTGLLLEAAGALLERVKAEVTGPPTAEQSARSSAEAIRILHSFGVTAFQDASASLDLMEGLKSLDQQGRLKAWVVSSMLVNDMIFGTPVVGEDLVSQGEWYRTAHHRPDFVKIFLDGVPPSKTGAFLEPYLPDDTHGHDHRGTTTMSEQELEAWLRRCDELGLGAKIHCTGDASVHMVLAVVARLRADGIKDMIVHIAHGQYVHRDDIPRFAELGVVAEISPALWYPGIIVEELRRVLPEPRASRIQPNRDLLDTGALIAGGSDWPVSESPNPWHAIYGLVTRQDPTGRFEGQLWPEQAITRQEAIRSYTSSATVALGLREVTGALRTGLSADLAVLDRDPFQVDIEELKDTVVLETWFAGERVHQASTP